MQYNLEERYNAVRNAKIELKSVLKTKENAVFFPGRLYYIERNLNTKMVYNRQIFCLCVGYEMSSGDILCLDMCKLPLMKRMKFVDIVIKTFYKSISKELESIFPEVTDCYMPEINKKSTLQVFSKYFDVGKAIKKINIKNITYSADICWADIDKVMNLCDKSVIANSDIIKYQSL